MALLEAIAMAELLAAKDFALHLHRVEVGPGEQRREPRAQMGRSSRERREARGLHDGRR